MRELTAERLRELVHYDPDTGIFIRKVTGSNRSTAGSVAGSINRRQGHVFISVDGKRYQAHRLAWLYVTGQWPTQKIDHMNRDGFDNRFANLRDVPQRVNCENRGKGDGTTSRFLGVCWDANRGLWMSQIKSGGKNYYLGHYDVEEVAHQTYVRAKRQLHAGCTI